MTVLSGSGPHRIPKFLGEKLLWQIEESLSRREDGGVQPTLLGDFAGTQPRPVPPGVQSGRDALLKDGAEFC